MDREQHIDEFESLFKRAEREPYFFEEVPIDSVAIVTDGDEAAAHTLRSSLLSFLPRLDTTRSWQLIVDDDFDNVGQLLDRLKQQPLDLIVTYRHLEEEALVPQHSLGVYLDVLTQCTAIPVLVLPGTAVHPVSLEDRVCHRLMVVTDHISGDNRLINYGARMCSEGCELWLCHVEDDAVFERYMYTIAQIPEIETDQARTLIDQTLLKEAQDYIDTCIEELGQKVPGIQLQSSVERGHHLRHYQQLVRDHQIDLLVANTKDEDQLAMHGMAYALAVEMIDVPMLML